MCYVVDNFLIDFNGRITESFNGSFETIQSRSNASSEQPHQQDEDSSEPSEISADTVSEITSSSSASEAIISTVISRSITLEEPGAIPPCKHSHFTKLV